MNNYTSVLREHNLKATPQRLEIANILFMNGHISIEELYAVMLKKFNSISLATIYKNVNLMLENHFIQEVKLPDEKSVYELSKDSHAHLRCTECSKVMDITLNLDSILAASQAMSKFKVEKTDLVLSGICQDCQ